VVSSQTQMAGGNVKNDECRMKRGNDSRRSEDSNQTSGTRDSRQEGK